MGIDVTKVRDLVEGFVTAKGLDLEDVSLSRVGDTDEIRVIVDRDGGTDLDQLGELAREISDALDEHDEISPMPYNLEITSPGIGRPLTLPRHWRRAQGRKVRIERAQTPALTGRIGALDNDAVQIVVNNRGRISVETIRWDDISKAVVEVDFSTPSIAELQRCGLDDDEIERRRTPGPTEL